MGTGGNNVPYVTLKRENTGRIAGWSEDDEKVLAYNGDKKRSTVAEKVYHKDNSKTYAITIANTPKYFKDERIRKLTPTECERLQGLPDGYTEGVSNTQRYKALGNAFHVDVVAHILSFIPR